jgi:ABC-type transport system involved in multi-copper enzyme maturation permease subunit
MRTLLNLASNTFRETIRDRILYVLLVFAGVMIAASLFLGTFTFAQERKLVLDLGLGTIELFGVAIALFLGTSMVFKEVDKRTVYIVLTKPVPRPMFLVGKFLGLCMTLAVLLVLMGLAFCGLAVAKGWFAWPLVGAIAMIGLQLAVIVAMTILFSTFTSPLLSMILTFCLYLIGHNTTALRLAAKKAAPAVGHLITGLYYVLPNLSTFEAKNGAVYGDPVSAWRWVWALGYGLAYTIALLATAAAIFERREF